MKHRDKFHAAYIQYGMTAELAEIVEEDDLKDVWALEDALANLITAHDVERKMAVMPGTYRHEPRSTRIKADYPRKTDGHETRHVFCYYQDKGDSVWAGMPPLAHSIPRVLRAVQSERDYVRETERELGKPPVHHGMVHTEDGHAEPEMSDKYLLRQEHILQIGECWTSAIFRLVDRLQLRYGLRNNTSESYSEDFEDFDDDFDDTFE